MVLLLQSASIERFSVFPTQDFFLLIFCKNFLFFKKNYNLLKTRGGTTFPSFCCWVWSVYLGLKTVTAKK